MELAILKKKLSTYRSASGRLMNVSDDLLHEILIAWEEWSGPASGFYAALGADHRKMASLIGRAKRLKREGHFPTEEFKEIKVDSNTDSGDSCTTPITMKWEKGKLIRFSQVDQLVEFLKKVSWLR